MSRLKPLLQERSFWLLWTLRRPLAAQHHWYDLEIASASMPQWRRRLAGHIETGRPSMSDPAIGRAVAG
ncbi:hypothetical protein A6R73_12980 [Xanthomonas translucens pv. poae]|uniref:Uncharacterized protein n=1 Tax=Xanthomonas graminis pv. poae TaxID=227946 RepID=A0A199P6R6_9XANT|nr:hypothetical protein A6R73_12980 [Xanthomonas translucens pv. poae]